MAWKAWKQLTSAAPVVVAALLLVGAGVWHGRATNRWSTSHALEDAVARVNRLDPTLDGWTAEAADLEADQVAHAGIHGYCLRRYTDRRKQSTVQVLLICGRPGPVSVHTPEICYGGAGYDTVKAPERVTLGTGRGRGPSTFWKGVFHKHTDLTGSQVQVWWAWRASGSRWEAPDSPRTSFAREHALYKLYVIRESSRAEPAGDTRPNAATRPAADPVDALLEQLLPRIDAGLDEA